MRWRQKHLGDEMMRCRFAANHSGAIDRQLHPAPEAGSCRKEDGKEDKRRDETGDREEPRPPGDHVFAYPHPVDFFLDR
jgi:hypothetical protein